MPTALTPAPTSATDPSALTGAAGSSASTSTSAPATQFSGQLRRAALANARSTVSLDQMVQTVTAAPSRRNVGLGAMTQAAATGFVARPSAVGTGSAAGDAKVTTVTSFALAQQGKPYVFATSGPDTFDCSGLVTAAYRRAGIEMPAYSFTQATYGRPVDPKTEAIQPGDLIFVRGGRPPKDLGHVGIALSATEWIQAPHTGDVVKAGPLPIDRVQVVRRIIEG